ncbi:MAG: hypothetical protein U0234_06205 [Sandaracinus sp.]
MCCFSRAIERVEETRIYARGEGARQLVVYEMKLTAEGELAMVLPIPVAPGTTQIELVDLSGSPYFFPALEVAFLTELVLSKQAQSRGGPMLAVQNVGAFEASFVPTAADFDRLDPRFALPSSLWARIPEVQGFGFVVFKLREPPAPASFFDRMLGRRAPAAPRAVHPMAFWFPRADPARLFFPTLHVHDGDVHAEADFDHVLYAQPSEAPEGWERSASAFDHAMAGPGKALVLARTGARRTLEGTLPNRDTWLDDRG